MSVKILKGDCRAILPTLEAESVHCVVTSPPYYALRDYGVAGQIGLEATVFDHLAVLVEVFREVRRVLRKDGTLWLNYGDAYAQQGGPGWQGKNGQRADRRFTLVRDTVPMREQRRTARSGFKPKDRMLLPARLAIALCDDGWWLRDEIVWHKPNPMPSSVNDRTTPAHEMIYLLSRSARYYYDADAIKEPASDNTHARTKMPDNWDTGPGGHGSYHRQGREKGKTHDRRPGVTPKSAPENSLVRAKESWHASTVAVLESRNKRSVWTVPSQPFPEAHFATFPPALIEPCILAGCPKGGTVLDPFGGAGTTGLVADRLQCNAVLIELNEDYAAMAERRVTGDAPLFAEVS